jgi:rhodanese-related sulfurtransferase
MFIRKTIHAFFVISLVGSFLLSISNRSLAQEFKKIQPIEAYDMLNAMPDTYLIDVRTQAEYQFVGHPLKAYLFPYLFFTTQFSKSEESQGYQFSAKNKDFLTEISKVFKKTDNLLIICRDGTRSALAAKDLAEAGFKNVYNVTEGFEGPLFPYSEDPNKNKYFRALAKRSNIEGFEQRRHSGWQWWGLPWTYDMDPKYIYPPDLQVPPK